MDALCVTAFLTGIFQLGELSFRGAEKIGNWWVKLAHLLQGVFGGYATIHDPDAIGFAVLGLDLPEKIGQGGFVRGVAGQDFVGDGKSFGRDDQCDDDLDAVASLVATVAEATDVVGILGRVALLRGLRSRRPRCIMRPSECFLIERRRREVAEGLMGSPVAMSSEPFPHPSPQGRNSCVFK